MRVHIRTNRRRAFEAFITGAGAELLAPTNEYEVLRFQVNGGGTVDCATCPPDRFCPHKPIDEGGNYSPEDCPVCMAEVEEEAA